MKLDKFDFSIVAFYFVAMLIIAVLVRIKKQNFMEYALTNRQMPSSIIFASLCATFIGPGYSLALSDKGFESGLLFFFIFSFFAIQTLLTAFVFVPRLHLLGQKEGCVSLGDVLALYFGTPAKRFVGLVSIILSIGFAAVMAKVGGNVLASLLQIDPVWGMSLVTLVGLLYAATGGLRAVAATEALQFSVILAAVCVLLMFSYARISDPTQLVDNMLDNTNSGLNQLSILSMLGLAISFFFGEMLLPPYANRALAANNITAAKQGFAWAGGFACFWFLLIVLLGGITALLIPNKPADVPALIALTSYVSVTGLSGLIIAAIAAIVMSSQESVLNAGASAFVREFGLKESTKNARWVSVVIGVLALIVASHAPSVISLLLLSYAVWAPAVAIPLAWALIRKNLTKQHFMMMPLGLAFSLYAAIFISNAADNGLAILYGVLGNISGYFVALSVKKWGVK